MHQSIDLNTYAAPFKMAIKNPQKFKKLLLANKKELSIWALLFVAIIFMYFGVSDGDMSFCYTLSALIQTFGFLLIAMRVHSTKSVNGLSLNTFICYAVALAAKLCSIIPYEGYLPYDATGDVIFRVSETMALIICLGMIYVMTKKYQSTYSKHSDRIPCVYLIAPAFVLACLIHPSLNGYYHGDLPWTFALYLESVAMFPQLYMLAKKEAEVEAFTSHFIASQGFGRCLAIIFWFSCYEELNEPGDIWTLFPYQVGYVVLLFQVIQILLFSDFLYEYIKGLKRGLALSLNLERYCA